MEPVGELPSRLWSSSTLAEVMAVVEKDDVPIDEMTEEQIMEDCLMPSQFLESLSHFLESPVFSMP